MSASRGQPPRHGPLPDEHSPQPHDGGGGGGGGGGYRPDGPAQRNGNGSHLQRDDEGRRQRRPLYNYGFRGHRSGALQWTAAVVFTVLAVAVLLAAVTVLVVVLLLQPRAPYLAVTQASLDTLVYDQLGALDDVQLSLRVEARNGNARSAAVFSRLELRLAFGGAALVILRADPLRIPPRGALPLAYVARARGATLDATRSAAVEAALRDGVVPFGVDGEARTAWKVAGLVAVHHWTRLSCELRFFWPNGTALHFSCNSKSNFWFF